MLPWAEQSEQGFHPSPHTPETKSTEIQFQLQWVKTEHNRLFNTHKPAHTHLKNTLWESIREVSGTEGMSTVTHPPTPILHTHTHTHTHTDLVSDHEGSAEAVGIGLALLLNVDMLKHCIFHLPCEGEVVWALMGRGRRGE